MTTSVDSTVPRARVRALFQFRILRLVVLVAVCAALLAAWRFRRDNETVERSLATIQLRTLARGDAATRRMAVENLSTVEPSELSPVVGELAGALSDHDWQVRRSAARAIAAAIRRSVAARRGSVAEEVNLATRALIGTFGDTHAEVRRAAALSVGELHATVTIPAVKGIPSRTVKIGTTDGRAVEPLTRLMHDPDPQVRAAACTSYADVAAISKASREPVLNLLEHDPEAAVRGAAVKALCTAWPDPDLVYPLLLRRLKVATTLEERATIGWHFGGLPAPPVATVPALVDALDGGPWMLKITIPEALAKLGSVARPALPALAKVARDELSEPQKGALPAARAVAAIDPDSAEAQALLEPLVALLRNTTVNFERQSAAVVLTTYGPSAAPAVPSLCEILQSPVADVRARATFLLGRIGRQASPARKALSDLMQSDPDSDVRRAAADALKAIGPN